MPTDISLTDILLMIIATTLVVIAAKIFVAFKRRPELTSSPEFVISIDPKVEEVIDRISAAAAHYADVSAVVKLVADLEADPTKVDELLKYPDVVLAAATARRADILAGDLKAAQLRLSGAYKYSYGQNVVNAYQAEVDEINSKLVGLGKLSGQTHLRSV